MNCATWQFLRRARPPGWTPQDPHLRSNRLFASAPPQLSRKLDARAEGPKDPLRAPASTSHGQPRGRQGRLPRGTEPKGAALQNRAPLAPQSVGGLAHSEHKRGLCADCSTKLDRLQSLLLAGRPISLGGKGSLSRESFSRRNERGTRLRRSSSRAAVALCTDDGAPGQSTSGDLDGHAREHWDSAGSDTREPGAAESRKWAQYQSVMDAEGVLRGLWNGNCCDPAIEEVVWHDFVEQMIKARKLARVVRWIRKGYQRGQSIRFKTYERLVFVGCQRGRTADAQVLWDLWSLKRCLAASDMKQGTDAADCALIRALGRKGEPLLAELIFEEMREGWGRGPFDPIQESTQCSSQASEDWKQSAVCAEPLEQGRGAQDGPSGPSLLAFNSIMEAFARAGDSVRVQALFAEMSTRWGLSPNHFSYSALVQSLCASNEISEARAVLELMDQKGTKRDAHMYALLMDRYAKAAQPEEVEALLAEMTGRGISPDVVNYTCLMHAYSRAGRTQDCLNILRSFHGSGGSVRLRGLMLKRQNTIAGGSQGGAAAPGVTDSCASGGQDGLGQLAVESAAAQAGHRASNLGAGNEDDRRSKEEALASPWKGRGKLIRKTHVPEFEDTAPPYSPVIRHSDTGTGRPKQWGLRAFKGSRLVRAQAESSAVLGRTKRGDTARAGGAAPGAGALQSRAVGSTLLGDRLHEMELDAGPFCVAINELGQRGLTREAVRLFSACPERLQKTSPALWTALIGAHCWKGEVEGAIGALGAMEAMGVQPNVRTANLVLAALCRQRDPTAALTFYRKAFRHPLQPLPGQQAASWLEPNAATFSILVNMQVRRGRFLEASECLQDMRQLQVQPNDVFTLSLIQIYSSKAGLT